MTVTVQTVQKDPMTWLEAVLKAERKSVEQTLEQRHAALLKELAPMLESAKNNGNGESSDMAIVTPVSGPVNKLEVKKPEATKEEVPAGWAGCLPCGAKPSPADEVDIIGDSVTMVSEKTTEEGGTLQDRVPIEDSPDEWKKYAPGWQGKLQYMLEEASMFDAFIGLVIVANSVCIGWEISYDLEGKGTTTFEVLEHIFLIVYIIELILRFLAYDARKCLTNPWILFDMALVLVGAIGLYIVAPIAKAGGGGSEEFQGLMVLRMLRLFRLVRLVRMMQEFKTLWQLISGLLGSGGTICYTLGLIGLILYIFSCLSLELITKNHRNSHNPDVHKLVNEHFTNLQVTMLSLSQFVTVDGLSDYIFPLVMEDPKLLLFFGPFVLVVSISLMNLVTAVIVEGAIQQSKADQEVKKLHLRRQFKKMLPGLKKRFGEMDRDGNALLTLDEVLNARKDIKEDLEQFVDPENLEDLFEMIDIDDSGEINCDEFCDGLFKLVSSESPVELIRILKQLKLIRKEFHDLKAWRSSNSM